MIPPSLFSCGYPRLDSFHPSGVPSGLLLPFGRRPEAVPICIIVSQRIYKLYRLHLQSRCIVDPFVSNVEGNPVSKSELSTLALQTLEQKGLNSVLNRTLGLSSVRSIGSSRY